MQDFSIKDISAADIVDTVRDGLLVLDSDLNVVSANRTFYASFHEQPETTIGQRLFNLGNGQWDIPKLRELLEEIIPQTSTVENYEVEHNFPSIGRKIMLLNARKIFRDGNNVQFLLLAIEDITAVWLKEHEAERNLQLAQNIVDTVRHPMVVLESDFTIITASRAFLQLFNIDDEQAKGRHLQDIGQGQWDASTFLKLLEQVVPAEKPINDFLLEDEFPGVGRRIFKINARKVFRPGDHVTRLLVVFEDATDATLQDRHRDVLAAELAHRIKNNLQVISAFVSFELRRTAPECVSGYQAMQARINAIAELYDVIAHSSAFGPVAMPRYLDGIASSIRNSALGEKSGITIAVEAEPFAIQSDLAVPIGLIVNELATNSVKYAFPDNKGTITLGFRRRDGELALTVSDDGIGLGAQDGSGLGSRFVAAFVHQVGGTMANASGESGTTFTIRLPKTILAE